MPKRIKYILSSIFSALGFYLFVTLPYDSRYYGLLAGLVLVIFCFWFGLGIIFDRNFNFRIMSVLLPSMYYLGFGLFVALLPFDSVGKLFISLVFGLTIYVIFLVENVFLVAVGYKTVPLYRAAYTVSLILALVSAFFLFDSLFSFRMNFAINFVVVFLVSIVWFMYQFFSITIELPDDGKSKNVKLNVLIPSWLVAQLALGFSFWPVGIFKGSVYLVSVLYVITSLMQAEIRERLFKKTWLTFTWIGGAIFLGVLLVSGWR